MRVLSTWSSWSALGDTHYPICYLIMIVIKVRHEEKQACDRFSLGGKGKLR